MRTPLLTLAVVVACAPLASASNMGFKSQCAWGLPPDPWFECQRASLVAEVRVLSVEPTAAPVTHGDLGLHAAKARARLSVRRTWKGVPRTQLLAETPAWGLEGGQPVLQPGMRAVVFVSGDEASGWRVTHWVPAPDGGVERRELALLMEEALRLQAAPTVEPGLARHWWLRAHEHPSFGLTPP